MLINMFKKSPRIYPQDYNKSKNNEIQLYCYESEYYISNIELLMRLISHHLMRLSENLFINSSQPFMYSIESNSIFYQLNKHNYILKIYVEKKNLSSSVKIEIVKLPKYKYKFMLETETHLIDRIKESCILLQRSFEELEESEIYMEGKGNIVLKQYGLCKINEYGEDS